MFATNTVSIALRTPRVLSLARSFASSSSSAATPNFNVQQEEKRGFFGKIWDQYSIQGQQDRIERGERLFRAAQRRAMDRTWTTKGRLPASFRSYHAILTMHVWLLHKRLTHSKVSSTSSLSIQEELFDIFWSDTMVRIRGEGINELMVNKHLKDVQQITLQQCVHFDHSFTFKDPVRRREELVLAVWSHVMQTDEDANNDVINRLAMYVEWQYDNVVLRLPEDYWREGRIEWGDVLDFDDMMDNKGTIMPNVEIGHDLKEGWVEALTESGKKYWWNSETMKSTWEKPVPN